MLLALESEEKDEFYLEELLQDCQDEYVEEPREKLLNVQGVTVYCCPHCLHNLKEKVVYINLKRHQHLDCPEKDCEYEFMKLAA